LTSPGEPSRGGPIRVVLADEHAALRGSLRRLVEAEPDLRVIAETDDLGTTVRLVLRDRPNVLVLDVRLADRPTLETIEVLRCEAPETDVVIITMRESRRFLERAVRAGARGFVLKDSAETELCEAVRRAAHGEPFVSPRVR
jgi:two-component system response regulator NreC